MRIRISDIIAHASKVYKVPVPEIKYGGRTKDLVEIRNACYVIAREMGHSYPQIGKVMGGYDHTTVLHGHRKALHFIERYPEYAANVEKLRVAVENHEPMLRFNAVPDFTIYATKDTALPFQQ